MNRLLRSTTVLFLLVVALLLTACQTAPAAAVPTAVAETTPAPAQPDATADPASIQATQAGATMHQREADNLAVVQRFYDEFAAGNVEVILDVHPETLTMHYAGSMEDVPSQVLYEDLAAIKAGIPDLHAEIHSMAAAGDYVFTELTWAGTHTGDLFGIPATGKPIVHNGILVRRLADGKIVESWEIWDDLTLLNGLGFVPSWDEIVAGAATPGALAETPVAAVTAETPAAAATTAAPSGPRPGVYYARLRPNNAIGVDGGYYSVRLGDDGSYAIAWFGTNLDQLQAGESGLSGVVGTYTIDGNEITFTDVEGAAACSEADGVTGVYRVNVAGDLLRFARVSDSCAARAHILSSSALTRLNR